MPSAAASWAAANLHPPFSGTRADTPARYPAAWGLEKAKSGSIVFQGQTLMDYVKSSYHYQSDRVSRALSDLTGKEDTDA